MDDKIIAGIISSVIGFFTYLITSHRQHKWKIKNDRTIEELKNEYAHQLAEKNARRDYTYEAKKKLYEEYEPLFFQLSEFSAIALSRIEGISKNYKDQTPMDEVWANTNNSYFRNTIYKIIAPLAIYKLIQNKLNSVDFGAEPKIFIQYSLLKVLYFSFKNEYKIGRDGNTKEDQAYFEEWRREYIKHDSRFKRQGFTDGQLDKIIECFIHTRDEKEYILNYGEFERFLESSQPSAPKSEYISIAFAPFRDFNPNDRHILWIILLVHACIHYIIGKIIFIDDVKKETIFKFLNIFFDQKKEEFSWSKELDDYHGYWEKARRFLEGELERELKKLTPNHNGSNHDDH